MASHAEHNQIAAEPSMPAPPPVCSEEGGCCVESTLRASLPATLGAAMRDGEAPAVRAVHHMLVCAFTSRSVPADVATTGLELLSAAVEGGDGCLAIRHALRAAGAWRAWFGRCDALRSALATQLPVAITRLLPDRRAYKAVAAFDADVAAKALKDKAVAAVVAAVVSRPPWDAAVDEALAKLKFPPLVLLQWYLWCSVMEWDSSSALPLLRTTVSMQVARLGAEPRISFKGKGALQDDDGSTGILVDAAATRLQEAVLLAWEVVAACLAPVEGSSAGGSGSGVEAASVNGNSDNEDDGGRVPWLGLAAAAEATCRDIETALAGLGGGGGKAEGSCGSGEDSDAAGLVFEEDDEDEVQQEVSAPPAKRARLELPPEEEPAASVSDADAVGDDTWEDVPEDAPEADGTPANWERAARLATGELAAALRDTTLRLLDAAALPAVAVLTRHVCDASPTSAGAASSSASSSKTTSSNNSNNSTAAALRLPYGCTRVAVAVAEHRLRALRVRVAATVAAVEVAGCFIPPPPLPQSSDDTLSAAATAPLAPALDGDAVGWRHDGVLGRLLARRTLRRALWGAYDARPSRAQAAATAALTLPTGDTALSSTLQEDTSRGFEELLARQRAGALADPVMGRMLEGLVPPPRQGEGATALAGSSGGSSGSGGSGGARGGGRRPSGRVPPTGAPAPARPRPALTAAERLRRALRARGMLK